MKKLKDPRIRPDTYYVYGVLCQDEDDGPLYIKFGKSYNLLRRLRAIRYQSPMPTRYFMFVEVSDDQIQTDVERALHQRFAPRRVRGEWFKFDIANAEDKRDFNDGCTEVFILYLGVGAKWEKVSSKGLFGSDETIVGSTKTSVDKRQKDEKVFEKLSRYRHGMDDDS